MGTNTLGFFWLFGVTLIISAGGIKRETCSDPEDTKFCQGGGSTLQLSFDDSKIRCGVSLPDPSSVQQSPSVTYTAAKKSAKYTLIMADPDAPGSGNQLEGNYFRHWGVCNIQGRDLIAGFNSPGDAQVLTDYMPPSPPAGSGPHRYNFWLLSQSEESATSPTLGNEHRGSWSVQDFMAEQGLCEVVASFQFVVAAPEN